MQKTEPTLFKMTQMSLCYVSGVSLCLLFFQKITCFL